MITWRSRHHFAVRRLGHQDRQGDWSLPPTAPGRGVPQIPRYHRGRGARRPRRPPDRGQLRHPQDGADPELTGQAAPFPYALHTHQRLLAEPGGALVRSAHRKAVAPRRASEQRRTGGCHLPLSGRHQRRSPTFCLDPDRRPNTGQRCPLLPTYFGYTTLDIWPETGFSRVVSYTWGIRNSEE